MAINNLLHKFLQIEIRFKSRFIFCRRGGLRSYTEYTEYSQTPGNPIFWNEYI